MHYFYSTLVNDSTISLNKEEAHHASRVLRLASGDKVGVFDGVGNIYHCSIQELSKSKCDLLIENLVESTYERSKLTLLIAPTKSGDRLEWFLEKATEIGVGEIILILSEHSERKKVRIDRLEKVVISAMKQSMNPYLPVLKPIISFDEAIQMFSDSDRFISHCYATEKGDLFDLLNFENPTAIMIGPEGDFSMSEIGKAEKIGWKGVSMGHQRLRTETAGVLAVHMYSLKENK